MKIQELNTPMKTFLESFYNTVELLPTTTFDEARNAGALKAYHSSMHKSNAGYRSGSHAGSKKQALIRADYMVNDEEKFDEYYLYELILKVENVYPELLPDDGSDHGYDYVAGMRDYELVFYKNTGEGSVDDENLSVIIIDPSVVIESRMIKVLTKDELLEMQDYLYG
jgi:hypothetical protein